MINERRYQLRARQDLAVQIVWRGRRFFAVSQDYSSDGMYLSTDHLTIPPGNEIELEFHFDGVAWLVPALVIHNSLDGLGVMFRRPQPQLTRPRADHPPIYPKLASSPCGHAQSR